ncbi:MULTISPECIES: UDP-N-acetylmuramoyl-L-alanine--D-glutamate ligase [Bacillus]|uniref:UDP-N-acetylmuramoyl-L-alanine--D-glutamate ligase n=1 Tax=Bacillus TaxID=1386 RepID=UPI00026B9D50|nr:MULTISPECIES: UDP-N-acetylmuramoyl-L-alanine--D-glutamate ligase [Bacillus]AIW29743.1 UDP-N-acetylmuramoyl-L-alanyl-D-glutamate synthetase [Bacillus subtilis]MBU8884548.1 UDP-N-acetylmuramoyl-L-alanine--D-glutamate ligase [Bacillus sp. FJAT-27001]AZG38891.1 UDP-N-acetylmuramoyl-L-alanine--D-glutamate ligase [Bacillus velezensis]EJD66807.1 UDP-N-acetylmuramoyl-L-alanyl-D-glutamate synthetase [Bacillus sp. 916]CDG29450.1 UDP-N-acetylmuramoylalanyl-D-glutamate ligase [Bacillus velezensis UCMB5
MENELFLQKQNFLVLGLAKSGYAAASILHEKGINVVVNDQKAFEENEPAQRLAERGIEVICGEHPTSLFDQHHITILIKNPGIPYENIMVEEAQRRGIPVWTEIELAYYITNAKFIGITGSNGKTTTTTLIYEMLKADSIKALVAGNIGTVASEVAYHADGDEWIVTELSSFQLMGTHAFRPEIGLILNVFDAHLDYHHSRENYEKAKQNVYLHQLESDTAIVNQSDETVVRLAESGKAGTVPFSVHQELSSGAFIKDGMLMFGDEAILPVDDIVLPGAHNLENILAAVAAAKTAGASNKAIQKVLTSFTGVKHRLQYVTAIQNRRFYNDSKATNILATSKALSAFKAPVILLAGGLDRGNGFDDLKPYMDNVKAVLTFGQTAPKIEKLGNELGIQHVKRVDNVEQAVSAAFALSNEGDVILLSPACASWDQFKTFEERGDMFIDAVHMLK